MNFSFVKIPGSVTAARGFRAAGVFCDIKRLGTGKGSEKGQKRDLALIVSDVSATVAGMFTTNQVCAAPVKVSIAHAARRTAQAVVVNSGNANACTGKRGLRDAQAMTEITGSALGLPAEAVLVGSTGRIGVPMPMANVKQGISAAANALSNSAESAAQAAEAIMTSDTRPKEVAIEFMLGGTKVRMGGICKGAGMIQPGMSPNGARPASVPLHATMLCFITTDAAIDSSALKLALHDAVAQSFNRITVDGDMSTNDTVVVLANGLAGNQRVTAGGKSKRISERGCPSRSITDGTPADNLARRTMSCMLRLGQPRSVLSAATDFARFQSALNHVTLELAKMIVRDGEGVSRFVTVNVTGARTFAEADAAARAVANSTLVKTSWCGGDPNWGRILDALGYSPAKVVEEKVDLAYKTRRSKKLVYLLRRGQPTKTPFKTLCDVVAQKEFELHINLNLGRASAVIYTSDLTEAYVDFNKGDIRNPAALGG